MPRLIDSGVPTRQDLSDPQTQTDFRLEHADPFQNLDTVEEASGGTLPTDITLTLAQSLDPADLHRASVMIARKLDFTPTFLLKPATGRPGFSDPLGEFKDPITGGVVSLATARRLLQPLEVPVMRSMLKHVFNDVQPERFATVVAQSGPDAGIPKLRRIDSGLPPTPERVSAAVGALSPLAGDTFPWSEALGSAIQIARTDVDLNLLQQNLNVTRRIPGASPLQQISLAHVAAVRGVKFHDVSDALVFSNPGATAPIRQAQTIAGLMEQQHAPVANYRGSDPRAAAMVEFQQQAGLAAAESADVQGYQGVPESTKMAAASFFGIDTTQTASDYLRMAKLISQRARVEQEQFQNTFAYKALKTVGEAWNSAYNFTAGAFWRGWSQSSTADRLVVPSIPGNTVADVRRDLQDNFEIARQIQTGKESIGQAFVTNFHLPSWSTPVVDLMFAFELDPTIIAGKVIGIARASKMLGEIPGALSRGTEAGAVAEKVNDFLNKPLRALRWSHVGSGATVPEYLVRTALRERTPEKFFLSAVDRFRTHWATEGIDRTTAAQIFDYARAAKGTGRAIPQIVEDVKGMLGRAFGLNVPGLPERLAEERAAVDRIIAERQMDDIYARYGQVTPQIAEEIKRSGDALSATRDESWLLSVLDDIEVSLLTGPRLMHEIPHFRPSTDLLMGLRRTGLADIGPARSMAATFNKTPRALFDLEGLEGPAFEEQIATYLKRARTHSQQEIASYRLNAARIADPAHDAREPAFNAMIQKAQDEVIARKAAKAGHSQAFAEARVKEARALVDDTNRMLAQSELYGVISATDPSTGIVTSELAREPLAVTQLLNKAAAVDPLVVERIMRGNFLSLRRLENTVRRTFGGATRTLNVDRSLADALGMERILSGWKRLVVTRPAYVTRVVLLDENLRYSATLGVLSHLESTRSGAKVLSAWDRLTGATKEPWRVTVEGPEGPITVEFQRPGHLPNEPSVSVGAKDRGILESMEQEARRLSRQLRPTGGFHAIGQDAPNFLGAWARDLNDQFGRDPAIGIILEAIAGGKTAEEGARAAVEFLKTDPLGKRYATRMAVKDLDGWGTYAGRVVAEYTANDPVIARAALSTTVDNDLLKGIPRERWPQEVHGAELERVGTKAQSIWHQAFDWYQRAILERPTNALNRQPYFKAWYTAAKRSMLEQAGVEGRVVDEALMARIEHEAGDFARGQVRRIMFDMRDQGRLGEMLRFVIPFFQPWAEAFQVWGRILQQNPAIVGYAYQAIHQGIESGFFHRDPDTGQLVVPMSNWLGAGSMLHAMFGGHWHLSAPLNGFNLFFNSTVPLPTGSLAGDVPIPFPGFSPPAMLAIQKLSEWDALPMNVRLSLASWAFQYGPTTVSSVVPRWLKYASMYVLGGQVDSAQFKATEDDFLRLQQMLGYHPRTDEPPPGISDGGWKSMGSQERIDSWDAYMAKTAEHQAREFFAVRSFISAFFPAAPKIEFPFKQYQREYDDLVTKLGFEGGRAEFLKQHPDLSLITIPNTMWNRDLGHSIVPIPATEQVQRIMQLPGFQDFAKRHPQWVWAIIPQEARNGKFDLNTYFAQIASGLRETLSPEEVLQEDDRQKGWDAYFASRTQHEATLDGLDNQGIGPGDPPYDQEEARWNSWLEDAKRVHPQWAQTYDSFETRNLDPQSVGWARKLAADPLFSKTEAGKWLKGYLPLLDEVFGEMKAHNIHSLQSKAARQLGIVHTYNAGVRDLNKAYPDGKLAYQAFFSDALTVKVTAGDRALLNLSKEQSAQVTQQWAKWQAVLDAPTSTDPGADKLQAFLNIRSMADEAFTGTGPNWLSLWWNSKDDLEKTAYLQSLAGRPYEFLSRFDRQVVLGETTTDSSEQRWLELAQDQLKIAKFRADNPQLPIAPVYEALDLQVAQWAQSDSTFAEQLTHSNDWGWSIRQVLPTVAKGSDALPAWSAFLDAVAKVQSAVDQPVGISSTTGQTIYLHGPDIDIDPKKRAAWVLLKQGLENYRDELFAQSPQFQREWNSLEQANGYDSLIDYIMPNTYFPVGGYTYAPQAAA